MMALSLSLDISGLVGITFHKQDAALAKRVKMHLNSKGCRSVLMDKSTMGLFDEVRIDFFLELIKKNLDNFIVF